MVREAEQIFSLNSYLMTLLHRFRSSTDGLNGMKQTKRYDASQRSIQTNGYQRWAHRVVAENREVEKAD